MNALDLAAVRVYVGENIVDFHQRRQKSLVDLQLDKLLQKNPYLLKAKNPFTAQELVVSLLDAFLSSSEEKLFGDFLEGLAVFVAELTCNGHKSAAPGVDLEFSNNSVYYVVSVKSGTNWGNSSQHRRLEQDLQAAATRVKQSRRVVSVQPVLGICYGKTRTSDLHGYLKVVGQNFWYLISENKDLYTDIIEPIGFRAKEYNAEFAEARINAIARFTKEFYDRYYTSSGAIDWVKLVEFNSGNYDLDRFLA